jgi:urease accessory protein
MRFPSVVRCFTAAPLAVLGSSTALAHVQSGEADGFLTGFLHPISGLDHVLAMVAMGLWGAPAIWLLPVSFRS